VMVGPVWGNSGIPAGAAVLIAAVMVVSSSFWLDVVSW
jgi:hypothetical protein